MLERLARWSYHHRWAMVGIWVVALVGTNFIASSAGGEFSQDFSLPGAESQEAYDLLREKFPDFAGETADIVWEAEDGVTDPEVQADMEALFAEIEDVELRGGASRARTTRAANADLARGRHHRFRDGSLREPRRRGGPDRGRPRDPEARRRGRATRSDDRARRSVIAVRRVRGAGERGMHRIPRRDPHSSDHLRFVLAMGLPILMALIGIGIGMALIMIFANFLTVPDFTPQLASMIGIGVGIDYALFIVTRYRQHLHAGDDPERANLIAIVTAGRAVLFAGTTVVISLMGILLMGFAFVEGVAVGGAATVLVTMLASVTLLPAVVGFVGKNIDRVQIAVVPPEEKDRPRLDVVPLEPADPEASRASRIDRFRRSARARNPRVLDGARVRRRGLRRHRSQQPARLRPLERGIRPGLQRSAASRRRTRRAGRPRDAQFRSSRGAAVSRGRRVRVSADPKRGRRRRDHERLPDDVASGRGHVTPRRATPGRDVLDEATGDDPEVLVGGLTASVDRLRDRERGAVADPYRRSC